MARINIEDSLFKDKRWINLLIKCGDRHKALGLLADAWILAQIHWLKHKCIPAKAWSEDLEILIQVELATRRNDGTVYVKGSQNAFAWLEQRSDAGKSRSKNKTQHLKVPDKSANVGEKHRTIVERDSNGTKRDSNGSNPLPLTLTLSPSPSLSPTLPQSQNSNTVPKTSKKTPDKAALHLTRKIWEAYKNAYLDRYKVEPVRNASVNGKISQLAKRLGAEGPAVVKFFVEHPKTFYVSKLHDIGLCLSDAEALRTQWARGKAITNADLKNYDQSQEANALHEAIKRGEV